MNEPSMIDEIKTLIENSKRWGNTFVSNKHLESLIRKYEESSEESEPMQDGAYQIRGGFVDAIQHDGSEAQASVIQDWVGERGGMIMRRFTEGTLDFPITYLRIDSPRKPDIAGPKWWVVKTADDIFFTMPDTDFHTLYIPREE